jgi:signal transduction histidine kinase
MGDVDEAVASLRELAHGIYPPLLASDGLARALAARVSRSELPVEIIDEGVGRCPAEVEAAIYFCCLEALQNITKYASAHRVTVQLERNESEVRFVVRDDGVGFDLSTSSRGHGLTNLQDRLDALAGVLTIVSAPGRGTTVEGAIPLTLDRQPQPA